MTSIGSALNNPPVSNAPSSKPNGYFPTKVADKAHRKEANTLLEKMGRFHFGHDEFAFTPDINQATPEELLTDIYKALESGVAIPTNPQELGLLQHEEELDEHEAYLIDPSRQIPDELRDKINQEIDDGKALLKKHQDENGHYNTDTFWADYKKLKVVSKEEVQEISTARKEATQGVFKENPQLLFEKAAAYPETVRRLVELLDLPLQNDKGWNLTSQAAKAGNPKLANAFEQAGFGPDLYPKVVVDFAKAMTDDAPNADKSKALKELMGVTPLS